MKPAVTYRNSMSCAVGGTATLTDVQDHPVLGNCDWVRTSRVQKYDETTGEIETLNTIYKRR